MKDSLYLVDGYGLIYRAYFAFMRNPLINSKGRNTSAVLGFFRGLFQLIRIREPRYLAVVMDSLTPTFRHSIYKEYKGTRQKTPDDLHAQIPIIEEILAALAIPTVRADGFEADDVIATLAEKTSADTWIFSSDKDLLQLVGDRVRVLRPTRESGVFEEMDAAAVQSSRGVKPEQIIDYLALMGDSSDNIPGVRGIGEKTAVSLLQEFESLAGIYENLGAVKSESQRRKLEEGRDEANLSRQLVTLRRDAPVLTDLESFALTRVAVDPALALFHEEDIHVFDKELTEGKPEGSAADTQPDLAREEEPAGLEKAKPGAYKAVLTEEDLAKWERLIHEEGVFAFDTETDSLDEMTTRPVGVSVAVSGGRACYVPIAAQGASCLPEDRVKAWVHSLVTDPSLKLVAQNAKFDYKVLRRWGVEMTNLAFDTMLAAFALDTTRNVYGLDRLARDLLGYQTIPFSDLIPKGDKRTLADLAIDEVTQYAAEDADITFRLYERLSAEIENAGLADMLVNLDFATVAVLGDMELHGIRVRPEILADFSVELEGKLVSIEREIYQAVGHEFNIASTKQLQEVLFEERKLKPIKKTKTGYSTDAKVLEELAREDEVCARILEHRTVSKLKSTYVDTLPGLINPATARIHTHYDQTGAATGRLASTDPNLQNIPVRDELGRRIRDAFVAEDGWSLLSADYSQIELVILAARSKDPLLTSAFSGGRDVHVQTAGLLFDVDEQLVTSEMRRIGKTINFGVIYGMSAYRFSRETGIPRADADRFIKTYFERFGGVSRLIEESIRQAETDGYVVTLRGRRRPIPTINSRNRTEKAGAERIAVNTPIQGSAADIVKMAMVALHHELSRDDLKARLMLQVHDELILEVPDDEIEHVSALVRRTMESVVDLGVALKVGIRTGKTWGQIE